MKDWNSIKQELYYEDGSLRDILVLNTNREDWRKWSSLVNDNYKVEFYNGRTLKTESRIDLEVVFSFWEDSGSFDEPIKATIKLGEVNIMCYFFIESEIENDIEPREVKTEENHQAILSYLQSVADILGKKVVLTPEMEAETILLEI
ncbi:hypothetical protein JAO76_06495 [Pontibacter sp. BT310]|uniref:Uncharacterized protein n=1 Tax=Pontibacter populi TaxID=890055 RepID=A0ABS6XB31_9BACT|nr:MULTISPECIES: hypothetical protein [Pontibacter]MBJ6117831.1 hypothetical protein [Pontibacter sp. BT310]MBR0570257.1 hypothetical protein [Microvirga sp. STS03]MBW3364683.1 hypothetical protein [Pontibacter populi]